MNFQSIRNFFYQKVSRYDIVFAVILIVATLVRMYFFDYPLAESGGEGSKDYLIARHIIKYGEFPLTGTGMLLSPHLSSPLYYYFLSLFLLIKDSILFLAGIFVFFQIFTIALVYFITKNISHQSALIATLFLAFSAPMVLVSSDIWPNYVMQLFVNIGFFLLLLSWIKKNYYLLLGALFFATLAFIIHNSAFAVLPFFILLSIYILKHQKRGPLHYIGGVSVILATIVLSYAPVFVYMFQRNLLGEILTPFLNNGARETVFIGSFSDFFLNITEVATWFSHTFSLSAFSTYFSSLNWNITLPLIVFSTLIYFLQKKSVSKKYIGIIALFVLQQFIFISLFNEPRIWLYLLPVLILSAILIAEVINSVFSKSAILVFFKILFIVIFLQTAMANLHLFSGQQMFLKNMHTLASATDALRKEILQIKHNEGFEDVDFFQIRSFRTKNLPVENAVLWVPLEKILERKFTKVEGEGVGYTQLNSDTYIFLACYDQGGAVYDKTTCKTHFLDAHREYRIREKEVFSGQGLSIYKAKRE